MRWGLVALIVSGLLQSSLQAGNDQKKFNKKSAVETVALGSSAVLVGGNITSWITANGTLQWPAVVDGNYNGTFPKGCGVGLMYDEGLLFGGILHDGTQTALSVNGVWYASGLQMGRINIDSNGKVVGAQDPSSVDVSRVWKVRPDYKTADLTDDATQFYRVSASAVTPSMIDSIRAQYQSDWNSWPATEGAPFVDANGDGVYEPGIDTPGIDGASQTIWTVANDLNPSIGLYQTPTIGIEVQVTEWAWPSTSRAADSLLNNVYYKQIKLIYKGTASTSPSAYVDSVYITYFSDTNDGTYGNEYIGCDSTKSYAFVYKASSVDSLYSLAGIQSIPSVGFDMVQGPAYRTGDPSDSAIVDLQWVRGYKYRYDPPMTSFWGKFVPSAFPEPTLGSSDHAGIMYNFMRGGTPIPGYPGFVPIWQSMSTYAGQTVPHTLFMFPGDPITKSGWIDGYDGVGDRRPYMSTGPFKMYVGDTAEIVVAVMGAMGNLNLTSLSVLGLTDLYAQYAFDASAASIVTGIDRGVDRVPIDPSLSQNYPNPFNPSTVIGYQLPAVSFVTLKVYDVLGREVRTLVNARETAGNHSVTFDAGNLPSGVYFYRLTARSISGKAGTYSETKKLVVLK